MLSFSSVNIETNEWYTYHKEVNVWIVMRKVLIQQIIMLLSYLFMRIINFILN